MVSWSRSGPSGLELPGRNRGAARSASRGAARRRPPGPPVSGSWSRTQRILVMVKEATGTSPVLRAKSSAPTSSVRCGRGRRRAGVVPQQRRPHHVAVVVQQHHAVLLARHRQRADVGQPAGVVERLRTRPATSGPGGPPFRPGGRPGPRGPARRCPASRTTTLQLWVEESTPATRVMGAAVTGSAGAEQVLDEELLQLHEAEALAAEVGVGVEVLVGGACPRGSCS